MKKKTLEKTKKRMIQLLKHSGKANAASMNFLMDEFTENILSDEVYELQDSIERENNQLFRIFIKLVDKWTPHKLFVSYEYFDSEGNRIDVKNHYDLWRISKVAISGRCPDCGKEIIYLRLSTDEKDFSDYARVGYQDVHYDLTGYALDNLDMKNLQFCSCCGKKIKWKKS